MDVELDVKYGSYIYESQVFMTLRNVCLLSKKIDEKGSEVQFESEEEEFFGKLLISKFPLVKLNKLTEKEIKSLIGATEQGEQGSKVKSSGSRSSTSRAFDQAIKENSQDYLHYRNCNLSLENKDELTSQFKTHEEKKFKCAHCCFESNWRKSLKTHLLAHSNLKLFKCSECSYASNRKDKLKIHLLNHSSLKLFKCSECSYASNRKDSLKLHLLTHTNMKLFKCSECGYGNNRKRDLKLHLLTHTNIKLFKCSECSYAGNRKRDLKLHHLTHSNLKLFKCSKCNYKCNRKDHLKRHILSKHETGTKSKEMDENKNL